MGLQLIGTGHYIPEEIVYNSHFTGRDLHLRDVDGRIIKTTQVTEESIFNVTGIRERRRAKADEWSSDMGSIALQRALEDARVDAKDLKGIICATVSEASNYPNAAQKIQENVGARNAVNVFDIPFACAGFPLAVRIAYSLARDFPGIYALVGADSMTKQARYDDLNSTLLGDGAGAAIFVPNLEEGVGIVATYSGSNPFDGRRRHIFRDSAGFFAMPDGDLVFKPAIREMIYVARQLKNYAGWEKADLYVPHQANGRIITGIEKRISSEGSVVFNVIETYANMAAATIPVSLDLARRRGLTRGKRVAAIAYAAGESTAGFALVDN